MKLIKHFKFPLSLLFVVLWQPGVLANDFMSVPTSALIPQDNDIVYSTNGVSLQIPPTSMASFLAPLVLPHGAIIRHVTMEAYDASGGEFGGYVRGELVFHRYNTVGVLATFDTVIENDPGDVRLTAFDINHQVDNSEYGYGFSVVINNPTLTWGDLKFYKFIVEYDQTQLRIVTP